MNEILAAVRSLGTQVEALDAKIDIRFSNLEDRVGGLATDVARLQSDTTMLRVDVMDRIDRLQDTVTSVKNDVLVNYGNTERVDRSVRNTEEQTRLLADQMSLLFKRLLGLDDSVRSLEDPKH